MQKDILWNTILIFNLFYTVWGQTGCGAGNVQFSSLDDTTELGYDEVQYLMVSAGSVTCPGVIQKWDFRHGDNTCLAALKFQVWRPDPQQFGTYSLVGANSVAVKGTTSNCTGNEGNVVYSADGSYLVDVAAQIPVQDRDVIGWVMYQFKDDGDNDTMMGVLTFNDAISATPGKQGVGVRGEECGDGAGDQCVWLESPKAGGPVTYVVRDYALYATIVSGPAPTLINLNPDGVTPAAGSTLPHITPLGALVFTVYAQDVFTGRDVMAPTVTYSIIPGNPPDACEDAYSIHPLTGAIHTLTTAPPACRLYVNATYASFPASDTGVLEVSVLPPPKENATFTITNLPNTTTVDAQPSQPQDEVFRVTVSNDTYPDTVFAILTTAPPGAPLSIYTDNTASPPEGVVVLTQSVGAWEGPTVYTLAIAASSKICLDGPRALQVTLANTLPLQAPVITSLDASISVTEAQLTANTGTLQLYEVTADCDVRTQTLNYSVLTVYPESVPRTDFSFTLNPANAPCPVSSWLQYVGVGFDSAAVFPRPGVVVEVGVADSNGSMSAPRNLTVGVLWGNTPPQWAPHMVNLSRDIQEGQTGDLGIPLDAADRESVLGDWIDYTVTSRRQADNAMFGYFRADNVTNRLYVTTGIYMQSPGVTSDVYDVAVVAMDAAGAISNVTIWVQVTVHDVNDHSPYFLQHRATGEIREDDVGGTLTGVDLDAQDDDGGLYATITYRIVEPEARTYFSVDSIGVVSVKQPVPWQLYPNITFHVGAEDGGTPPLTARPPARVTITNAPANMHAPAFTPHLLLADVSHSAPRGAWVANVTATDIDPGFVNNYVYHMLTLQSAFTVSPTSGVVTTMTSLDAWEEHAVYVSVIDNGMNATYYADVPCMVYVLTYDGWVTQVDIHLYIPLTDFLDTRHEFMERLGELLYPWQPVLARARLDKDRTVVTVYALHTPPHSPVKALAAPGPHLHTQGLSQYAQGSQQYSQYPEYAQYSQYSQSSQDRKDMYVSKDELLDRLQTDIDGTPSPPLLSPAFAPWQPWAVYPTHYTWLTDTRAGRITLLLLLLLITASLILITVCCLKRHRRCCFHKAGRPQSPGTQRPPSAGPAGREVAPSDGFKLNYTNPSVTKPKLKPDVLNPILMPAPPVTYNKAQPTNNPLIPKAQPPPSAPPQATTLGGAAPYRPPPKSNPNQTMDKSEPPMPDSQLPGVSETPQPTPQPKLQPGEW